ncbi:MAG: archaellin/type IV pilin N-terminal domain-containing protein [Thermoplasmata archaeon]
MKLRKGVSPVIATVLLVIITVVLSATLYFFLAGSMSLPTTSQTTPMGLRATLRNDGNLSVEIVSAPAEARINGSNIVVISAVNGTPLAINATLYSAAGNLCGNYSSGNGWNSVLVSFYTSGMLILIQKNPLMAKGDTVQISGTGFALSTCTIM